MFWDYENLNEFFNGFNFDLNNISPTLVFIDILITSFIFFKIYVMLRQTKGLQLIIGVGLFYILGLVANYFQLELLDWLISNIKPALVFVVIVLLQPELRRNLTELTKIRFINYFIIKPSFEIDEIIESVKIMSQEKTGSIIVFAKDISLKSIIEQSIHLDAIISSSLILTIFKKNSALHDGALIIEQNRIASASSYLPMSNSLGNSTLGARHRSALGLAEETDAVVLVTSEETGEISICHDGNLIHPVKIFELKNQLLKFLKEKKGIKK
jgi:diadenylate cyclase